MQTSVLLSHRAGSAGGRSGSSGSRGDAPKGRGTHGAARDPGKRQKMVAARLFEVLSLTVISMVEDPRLIDVSVSHVDVTPDLSLAKVYISSAAQTADLGAAVDALVHAAGFLRRQLAGELNLRRVPELRFFPDTVLMEAWRLDDVIAKLDKGEEGQ
jgi:ribosome-binding factor A